MIKYKTNISIKDYYLASFLGLINGGLKKVFLISLLVSLILVVILSLENTKCFISSFKECLVYFLIAFVFEYIIFVIGVFLYVNIFIFILMPLIKFLLARFYWKQKNIEYFFDKEEFGWEIAGNKLTYKKNLINYIKVNPNYFLIELKLKKILLVFVADKKTIKATADKLKNTLYKEYIK